MVIAKIKPYSHHRQFHTVEFELSIPSCEIVYDLEVSYTLHPLDGDNVTVHEINLDRIITENQTYFQFNQFANDETVRLLLDDYSHVLDRFVDNLIPRFRPF